MSNSIDGIIMRSCSRFHDMNEQVMNRFFNESLEYDLDEANRDQVLAHAGRREDGVYDGSHYTDKNMLKGTNKKSIVIPKKDSAGNVEYYVRGPKKGMPKTEEIGTVKLQSATFSPSEFFDSGDLIMVYSYEGSVGTGSNVRNDNGTHVVHVKYEKLLQAIAEKFRNLIKNNSKKSSGLNLKTFESAINSALESVDVYVNCQCRDFVQRYLSASKKKDMFFNLKKDYGISTGSDETDIVQGTGQSARQTRDSGFCAHIVNALTNKRERVYRTKFNGKNFSSYIWNIIKSGCADDFGTPNEKTGHTLLYTNFVDGIEGLEKKYVTNESFDFIDIMEYAKEYIDSNDIAVVSGELAEDMLESISIDETADLDDYSIYSGTVDGNKVLVIESDSSAYAIYDQADECELFD